MKVRFLATVGIAAMAGSLASGLPIPPQGRTPSKTGVAAVPAFEAASIKPNKSDDRTSAQFTPAGYTGTHVTMGLLVHTAFSLPGAFGLRRYLEGGEDWIYSDPFDITARSENGAIPDSLSPKEHNDRIRLMLQALLTDRFQLKFHRETRQVPVYELVVGKNGPKVPKANPTEKNCPGVSTGNMSCQGSLSGGMGRGITAPAVEIRDLAQFLASWTDRPIIDKTGMKGLFEVKTTPWKPDNPGPNFAAEAHADPETLPTIFTMIQEQLGLRLQSAKGPIEILVIDHAARPSEN